MIGIDIKKVNDNILIKWQLTEVIIPLSSIVRIIKDDTYAGKNKQAIRIGTLYGTTDRIMIETKKRELHSIYYECPFTGEETGRNNRLCLDSFEAKTIHHGGASQNGHPHRTSF
uniref:SunI/YnzG family protein n=1 Tax=Bacillus massiliglaciei TaxID=1816693 RepID=UPI0038995BA9